MLAVRGSVGGQPSAALLPDGADGLPAPPGGAHYALHLKHRILQQGRPLAMQLERLRWQQVTSVLRKQ